MSESRAWEAYLFDHHRAGDDPTKDEALASLWAGFERILLERSLGAERIATPAWEPIYEEGNLWQGFLRQMGYNQGEGGQVFVKGGKAMSKVFRQSFPAAKLSLERATRNVPDDGQLHLLVDGKIVKSFRTEKAAQAEYQAHRKAYLADHPIEHSKVHIDDVIREDQKRLSNKELIWSEEDFVRVDRATKRRN